MHRVGRTGRAGKSGRAITFITPSEYRKLMFIQKIAKTDIKKADIPQVKEIISAKKTRIKDHIQSIIDQSVDPQYTEFAEQLLSLYSPKEALSAVLKASFESEFSEDNYTNIKPSKQHTNDKGSSYSKDKRRGKSNAGFVDMKGQTRLFIAKGKLDKMNARSLVSYIEDRSKVRGNHINDVQVYDKFSFINVSFKNAQVILDAFKKKGSQKRSLVELAK